MLERGTSVKSLAYVTPTGARIQTPQPRVLRANNYSTTRIITRYCSVFFCVILAQIKYIIVVVEVNLIKHVLEKLVQLINLVKVFSSHY